MWSCGTVVKDPRHIFPVFEVRIRSEKTSGLIRRHVITIDCQRSDPSFRNWVHTETCSVGKYRSLRGVRESLCLVILYFFFCLALEYDRYKFIVQVVIGEQRGEGVKLVL